MFHYPEGVIEYIQRIDIKSKCEMYFFFNQISHINKKE